MEVLADDGKLYSQYNNEIQCDNEEEINFCAQSKDGETWTVPSLTNIENTDTVHYETFDNSDTGSWNSDTPLLLVVKEPIESKLPETVDVSEKTEMDKNSVTSLNVVQNDAHTTVTVDETNENIKNEEDIFGSDLSIAYSIVHDFEVVQTNPVNVFGSGWEFGSVCSIYGSGDVYKNHSNTVERLGFNPLSAGQDRLLSKIFKEKIGSMQFDKSMFGESTKFTNDDKTIDIAAPVKTKNLKNLLILSTGVTLLHVAIFGLRNLQSSMNSEGGLGVYSLATLFGAFMFGSLASPFIVQRYKPKLCMSVSCFGHLVYVVANYFPSFYAIIPASVIYGLSNALLWNALCTYITELGLDEAFLKRKITSSVLSRYFGIFFLVLQMSMVLGNLISSIIFSQSDKRMKLHQDDRAITGNINNASTIIYELISNGTGTELTDINFNEAVAKGKCGAAHCELSSDSESKSNVDDLDKLFLLGTYSSCAVLSILVIQCFLDKLPNYTPHCLTLRESLSQAGSVVAMVIDPKFCFIVMLCLYTVISNGFVVADVLKAYVTCPLGVRMVGYSMICFGICGSISSYIFGKLAKCTGNLAAFIVASALNVTSLALMAVWEPSSDDQYLLFAFIGAWGFADGIWQSQINSLISSLFADRYETAFGCCRVLQGLAGIIVFTLSNMLCMMSKIIFTTATCILSVVLYIAMEVIGRRSRGTGTSIGTEIYVK